MRSQPGGFVCERSQTPTAQTRLQTFETTPISFVSHLVEDSVLVLSCASALPLAARAAATAAARPRCVGRGRLASRGPRPSRSWLHARVVAGTYVEY